MQSDKWKPGVPKNTLLLIAGLLWIGIGVMLDAMAYSWLRAESSGYFLFAAVTGFFLALLIHHFGFLRIVDSNLARILPLEGRRCIFSFMPWKSYLLILIMISAGVLLRHSPMPKKYLAVLYISVGTALILSSMRYLRYLIVTLKQPLE